MTDGIYTINYTGQAGFGIAVIVFKNGSIVGVDAAGGEYSGNYQVSDDQVSGQINLHVPAGVPLVTGAPVSATAYDVPIPFAFPSNLAEKQVVQTQVRLPTGPVNANVKKMKNLAA